MPVRRLACHRPAGRADSYLVLAPAASQAAQDQSPQPTFRTEVNYVRVDVYPTRDERPVSDLTQDDFEVLDNGTPQKIEQFEHVVIRAAGPQETRIEPNTVRESRSMLENARSRVFVLFLDTYHVDPGGSWSIRDPLIEALDKVIGADDLVGVMTPEMSPGDIAFARKTTTIEGMLSRYWHWGERDRLRPVDRQDQLYEACYGPGAVATEMIQRRHEKLTLDALEDLVIFLRGVREERKAVLAISDGWLLFRPNPGLANKVRPEAPLIGVDPRNGKITTGTAWSDCDRDRIQLAQVDHEQQFGRLLDQANRSNTSFYPIDPRGLAVLRHADRSQSLLRPSRSISGCSRRGWRRCGRWPRRPTASRSSAPTTSPAGSDESSTT